MATAQGTNPRDFIRKIAVGDQAIAQGTAGSWIEIKAAHEADLVEVYIDPEDANQDKIKVKHRSDDPLEEYELLAPDQRLLKGSPKSRFKGTADLPYKIRKGDTVGFFQGTVNGQTPKLVVKEYSDPSLGANPGGPEGGIPFAGPSPFPVKQA